MDLDEEEVENKRVKKTKRIMIESDDEFQPQVMVIDSPKKVTTPTTKRLFYSF